MSELYEENFTVGVFDIADHMCDRLGCSRAENPEWRL